MKRQLLLGTIGLFFILLSLSSLTSAFALSTSQASSAPRIRAGSGTSTNWSGYAVTGSTGSVSDVKGSWIVPSVTATSTNSYSSFWVGIDGFSSGTVEQIGTDSDWNIATNAPAYYAWFEFYPKASYTINSITVHPGDIMSAEVQYLNGGFKVSITDMKNGQSFSTTAKVPSAQRSSAEWIAEAPSSGGVLPLANFDTVYFGSQKTRVTSTCLATIGGSTGSIASFGSNVQEITMVDSSGATIALPSPLSSDGTSFSVQRTTPVTSGSLSVSVTTDSKNPYTRGSTVYITTKVTDDKGNIVAGAAVTVNISNSKGIVASGTGTTDSSGSVVFRYKIGPRTPTGTYIVNAVATASGYSPGTGSTNFQVA